MRDLSRQLLQLTANMQSLAARLDNLVPLTSKDSAYSENGVVLSLRRIDLTLEYISKSLVVHQEKIEHIVQNQETIMNMVNVLTQERRQENVPETKSQPISWSQFQEENQEWLNSLHEDPVHTTFPDMSCLETFLQQSPPWTDLTLKSSGSVEPQAPENQGGHMN